jgi:hypothetical protein
LRILDWGFWICCIARAAQALAPRVALSFFIKLTEFLKSQIPNPNIQNAKEIMKKIA